MPCKPLFAAGLALLLAAGPCAAAQDAPLPGPPMAKPLPSGRLGQGMRGERREHGDDEDGGFGERGFDGSDSPVIADLRALERLYLLQGRGKDLPALYNSVLAKSQDPRVRNYVYHHLARAQLAPANIDQAIATLRKSLDEDLAAEAKRREDMEKMRALWEQRHNDKSPPPTP
jgi:hypothetical protein